MSSKQKIITYSKYFGTGLIITFSDEKTRDQLFESLKNGYNLFVFKEREDPVRAGRIE